MPPLPENSNQQTGNALLTKSVRRILSNNHVKKISSCSALAVLALGNIDAHAATVSFILETNGVAQASIAEPPADAVYTANVGVVVRPNGNEFWQGTCTVSGRVEVSESSASEGSDFRFTTSQDFTLDVETISDGEFITFQPVSQDITLEALADFEVESLESVALQIVDVRAFCGEQVVSEQVSISPYGATVDINDTFNESEVPPETPPRTRDVPESQKSLKTQINDMNAFTVHTAEIRTRSISKELQRSRQGHRGARADNLKVSVNGTEVPKNIWQAALNGLENTAKGAGAGDGIDDLGRWGFFISGAIDLGERKSRDSGRIDYDSSLFIAGLDYQVNTSVVAGAALSHTELETDVPNGSADTNFDRTSFSIFTSYFNQDIYYLDVIATYGMSDYQLNRVVVDDSASAETDGNEFNFSVGGGMNFRLPTVNLRVFSQLNYLESGIDGYTEVATGLISAAEVNDIQLYSLVTDLGLELSWNINTNVAVFSPQVALSWEHQFKNDPIDVNGNFLAGDTAGEFAFQTERVDNNYFSTQLGVTAAFKAGFTAFATYDTYIDRDDLSSNSYTLGARWQF